MRTYIDCVPCFVRQALAAARLVSSDEAAHERVLRRVLDAGSRIGFEHSPPYIGREIHRIIREETGSSDPYADIKRHSTEAALELLGATRARVETASDPFDAAVRFAIAGNVMDFALAATWDGTKIGEALDGALSKDLAASDVGELEEAAGTAATILYIGDNAGEIVLDRLLLERLPEGRVKFAVRGSPVINDAVREDAEASGIGQVAEVVDTGSDAPGVILDDCSGEFRELFSLADVVIAKGQGNYESLCDCGREVFFLTQVKCDVIARDTGAPVGGWMCLCRAGRGQLSSQHAAGG